MRIEVITPHGFCGGVERAIRMAHELLDRADGKVYGLHEIVHNETVVQELTSRGMEFVDSVSCVPDGATMLVSAHGTSPATFEASEKRGIKVVDATCPFVIKGHERIRENFKQGIRTVVIGKPTHAEVLGYLGEKGACLPEDVRPGEKTEYVVQTTLDAEEYEGVCTATRDRQQAVRNFVDTQKANGVAASSVGVLVVGSSKSSNTCKLVDLAKHAGAVVWLIGNAEEAGHIDFSGIEVLGITSGASTPEELFRSVQSEISLLNKSHSLSGTGTI